MTISGQSRMARTLQILKEAEKFGESAAIEVGRRYEMDLSIFEDWVCVSYLLLLSREEKGNLRNCYWSEQEEFLQQGADIDFDVPTSWFKDLPKEGEFQFTYAVERRDCIRE